MESNKTLVRPDNLPRDCLLGLVNPLNYLVCACLGCFHGHCANRHVRDLLRVLDIEVSAGRIKPTIRVMAGEMNRVVDAAERELAQLRRHYQRGDERPNQKCDNYVL